MIHLYLIDAQQTNMLHQMVFIFYPISNSRAKKSLSVYIIVNEK